MNPRRRGKRALRRGNTRARWEHGCRSLRPLPRRAGRAAGANRRSHRTHAAAPDDVDSVVRRSKPRNAECRDGGGQGGRYCGEPCRGNERFRPARPRSSSPDSSVGRRRPVDLDRVRPGERASSVAVLALPRGHGSSSLPAASRAVRPTLLIHGYRDIRIGRRIRSGSAKPVAGRPTSCRRGGRRRLRGRGGCSRARPGARRWRRCRPVRRGARDRMLRVLPAPRPGTRA